VKLRLLQLDEPHYNEEHEYPEGLFVTDGKIDLLVDGKAIAVHAGGMYIVPPGAMHSVISGKDGTLVIFK
jgi:quercetin dioxygenase-like cupin family protein